MLKPKDYREDASQPGVELIVRPGNRYGVSQPGERVLVDERELRNSSTRSACMTAAEADDLERKREEARQAAAARAAAEKRTGVRGMVDAALSRIMDGAEDPRVRAAKARAEAEILEADRMAAAAAASAEADRLFDADSSESPDLAAPAKAPRRGKKS